MSTIKAINLVHPSGSTGITMDTSGNATVAGSLVANSSMGWRNRIINGDMRIDQRNAGASVTPTDGAYSLDRWVSYNTQTSKYTVQRNAGSVTPPSGFSNYLGVTSSSAYSVTSSDTFSIVQNVEGLNTSDLAWGSASALTVTLSFWVRSSLTGTFGGAISNSALNRAYPFTYTISAANTWEQKSVTISGDTSGTWLTDNGVGVRVWFSLGAGSTYLGTAGAWAATAARGATGQTSVVGTNGATWYVTGVQLETGTAATPFERRDYGRELILCQRYFQQIGSGFSGMEESTTSFSLQAPFQVVMRASPTLSLISTSIATRIPAVSTDRTITGCAISTGDGTQYSNWVVLTCSGGNVSGRFIQNRNGGNIFNATAEL